MKIKVGQKRSRYTHDKSCINNTTMDFGFVQPTFRAMMVRNSDINIKVRQFVRLAPMPLPTLADVRVKNVGRFVPMSEINLAFDPMMSNMPLSQYGTSSYIVNNDFQVYAYVFRNICLNYSQYSIYNKTSGTNVDATDTIINNFNATYKSGLLVSNNYAGIPVESADYVCVDSTSTYVFCFRFNDVVKRLRKIFLGLGYQLTDASTPVSFSPILAYYKAYFDEYFPKRYTSWSSTPVFGMISGAIESSSEYSIMYNINTFSTTLGSINSNSDSAFATFFYSTLPNCFASQNMDLVSLAMSSTSATASNSVGAIDNIDNEVISNTENHVPFLMDGTSITKVALDVLRHLTHYVNKDTAIGKRIAEWCKVHYGEDVVNQLYAESHRAGEFVTRVDIGDVMSQADTVVGDNGEYLGSYAGRGIGSDGGAMHYKASEFGFFIVLSHVDVNNRYYQGVNPELFAVDRFTYPSSEFDAIGYEILPQCAVIPNNDVSIPSSSDFAKNLGFGYLPRYSGLKLSQNVINGDLSRRGTIDSYSAYTIDKMIVRNTAGHAGGTTGSITVTQHSIPTAGITWQFLGRYDYLTNYNRIFYDTSGDVDNFIVHTAFDAMVGNFLLPMTLSYDTVCENDNARVDVAKQ